MTQENQPFIISKEDWSLHRKGYDDQKRHQEKVQEAIRKNLPDLVTEENIILSNGKDVVRIPIRSLDEYKIRYNHEKNKQVGQGKGKSNVGDVIARDGMPSRGQSGTGQGAGNQPGEDVVETEISLMELEDVLFAELELPEMKRKDRSVDVVEHHEFNDIRKNGLMGNIDKKRTLFAAFKRNALSGEPAFYPILKEDLRFKTWTETIKHDSSAVVLALMDTSGSMGQWEKYMARSFFFWMTRFLRTKYEHVSIEFIAHHTEAKVVPEEDFFTKGESGGTICSSAYEKALELIEAKYPPSQYNIYPFHFSDGDNLTSDNPKCVRLIKQLLEVANLFGYGEVNQYSRSSSLMSVYKDIQDERFKHYIIRQKSDVLAAMKYFFHKQSIIHA